MARVVQPRKSPPYVAIIFVFTTLIAGSLAVIFHMQKSDAEQIAAQERAERKKYAQEAERRSAEVAVMERAFQEASGDRGAVAQTVTAQLIQQVRDLSQWITGGAGGYEQAKEEKDKFVAAQEDGGSFAGFVNEIRRVRSMLKAAREKAAEARDRNEALAKENEQKAQRIQEIETKFDQEIKASNQTISQLQTAKKTQHDEYLKKLGEAEAVANKNAAELNDTITKLNAELEKRQIEINKLAQQLAAALRKLNDSRSPGPQEARPEPDGKVIRLVEGTDRCYINIGARNNVKVGMTFSVWPSTGIPARKGEEEQPKALLVVTNVSPSVSECRITEQKKSDPLIEDDLVSNIAFDENRVFTFVVEGKFDLLGKGAATEAGAEAVKQLIRRVGGKVVDEVNIDTDFVVIGEEPIPPPKPADDAPPQVWKVYQEQMKTYQAYKSIQGLAANMRIPVLNANRFLSLIGMQMASAE